MLRSLAASAILVLSSLGLAAPAASAPSQLLPKTFAGWQKTASVVSADPAKADAANAALLKEYSFNAVETATYSRDNEKLQVRAAGFADATGAFGTFSFYLKPGMTDEKIGDRSAALRDHILFQRSNFLMDAVFDHPSPMSASELRELAANLQTVGGGAATPPGVINNLPPQSQDFNSVRYVAGPVGLGMIGSPLPNNVVDFSRSAELATAQYRVPSGLADLYVVSYPTPQIAVDHERALVTWVPSKDQSNQQTDINGTLSIPTAEGRELTFRRSGPLLIFASGDISSTDARDLVQRVNYRAEVTWNQPAPLTGRAIGGLIVGIFLLVALLIAIVLIIMIFFGGTVVVLQRLFPNRQFLPAQRESLIKLNLKD
jgi:hypothetical protein